MSDDAAKHGWSRWKEVTKHTLPGHRLFRSSCPGYNPYQGGKSQHLTQTAVDWLTKNNVNSIISFNQLPYTQEEVALLNNANIAYRHYRTEDFTSPALADLKAAAEFHDKLENAVTLVHCGYGHGRTGTGISAIQLYAEDGKGPTETEWVQDNHVETKDQVTSLAMLVEYYQQHPRHGP